MARSSWSAAVLTLVAIAAALLGGMMLRDGRSEFDGLAAVALAIVATGCGCTAAVLWARDGRGP